MRRLVTATALLLAVEFLDELYSGAVGLGAASIQETFAASYTQVSAALLFGPALVALVIEPFLFVLADRYPRKWFLSSGTIVMGVGGLLAAVSPSLFVVGVGISLAYLGSGAGVAMAQATLVDRFPEDRERSLARWTLWGEIGDLFAPVLVGLVFALEGGWRSTLVVVSLAMITWGIVWFFLDDERRGQRGASPECSADGHDEEEEEDEPGVIEALRIALTRRDLLGWLGATAMCDFMDDLLTIFAVLYLEEVRSLDVVAISVVIGAGVFGSISGLVACERLFLRKVEPLRLLWMTSVMCGVFYSAWLFVEETPALAVGFFLVGFSAAPMYPITVARAYAALPGQSGTVNAVAHLFTPLTLSLPLGMGLVADSFGLEAALWLVLVQPIALGVVALRTKQPPLPLQG